MKRIILDLDDSLGKTTECLQGDPRRIKHLRPVKGALRFLQKHGTTWISPGRCILLTAGVKKEQNEKIKVLGMRKYFREIHIVSKPEDKSAKLEELVRHQYYKPHEIVVIGDRLDTELRTGKRLGCVTVRMKIPSGRHSDKLPQFPTDHADFEVKDFNELMEKYKYFRY